MARTTLNHINALDSGVALTLSATDAINGMQFQNNGNQVLIVNNASAAAITVTVDFAADTFGRDGVRTISVAAGAEVVIGPFIPTLYNQGAAKSYVHVDFSADTSVTAGVVSLR